MAPGNPDPYNDGGAHSDEVLPPFRHVARSVAEAASALGASQDAVARLLLRGRLAPAVLLPRWQPALAALAQEANVIDRTPDVLTPALEDEAVAVLLESARRATPAPSAYTPRTPTMAAAPYEAASAYPDPLYAVRLSEWRVIGRELRLQLTSGHAVSWPVDRHPALARIATADLARDFAVWGDAAAAPTWTWGTDDALTLVSILRDPACRLVADSAAQAGRSEP